MNILESKIFGLHIYNFSNHFLGVGKLLSEKANITESFAKSFRKMSKLCEFLIFHQNCSTTNIEKNTLVATGYFCLKLTINHCSFQLLIIIAKFNQTQTGT